jgi:hypothetical protein
LLQPKAQRSNSIATLDNLALGTWHLASINHQSSIITSHHFSKWIPETINNGNLLLCPQSLSSLESSGRPAMHARLQKSSVTKVNPNACAVSTWESDATTVHHEEWGSLQRPLENSPILPPHLPAQTHPATHRQSRNNPTLPRRDNCHLHPTSAILIHL